MQEYKRKIRPQDKLPKYEDYIVTTKMDANHHSYTLSEEDVKVDPNLEDDSGEPLTRANVEATIKALEEAGYNFVITNKKVLLITSITSKLTGLFHF